VCVAIPDSDIRKERPNRMKDQTQDIALRAVALTAGIPIVWLCIKSNSANR
jgi:hypothetical protein